jgi:WD40 repeat protein
LWDVEKGEEVRRFEGHEGVARRVAFSPKGDRVLTGCSGEHEALRLWDAETGKQVRCLAYQALLMSLAYFADGRRVACAGGYDVHVFDAEAGTELRPAVGHTSDIQAVALSPDGRHVASGNSSGTRTITARLWDLDGAKPSDVVPLNNQCLCVGFSPDGQRFFYTGQDYPLSVVDAASGKAAGGLPAKGGGVWFGEVCPDGRHGVQLHQMSVDNQVEHYCEFGDLTSDQLSRRFQVSASRGVVLSPDGRRALTGGEQKTELWDLSSMKKLHEWPGEWGLFTPDERIPPLEEPWPPDKRPVLVPGRLKALSDDGTRLAEINATELVVSETATKAVRWRWQPPAGHAPRSVALSPDGHYLIAGMSVGTVYVFRVP